MNDQFDKKIKETLEGFELPYDANAWNQLNGKLNRISHLKKGVVAASLLSILIIGSVYLLNPNSTKNQLKPTQLSTPKENIDSKYNQTEKYISIQTTKKEKKESLSIQTQTEKSNFNEVRSEASLQTELIPNLVVNPISIITQQENIQVNLLQNIHTTTTEPKLSIPFKVCLGDEIHFNYLSDNDFWIIDPSGSKVLFNSTFSPQMDGKFIIVSGEKTVGAFTVFPTPKIELSILDDDKYENGLPIAKFLASGNAQNYEWQINNHITTGLECEAHLFNKGSYPIQLSAQNSLGCRTEITKEYTVENDYNLLASSAFDIHSNDKRNTHFMPFALTVRAVDFSLIIIDPKDGGVLFETIDANNPWLGIDKRNGQLVEAKKPYIWKVVIKNPVKGEKPDYKGVITRM